MEPEFIGGEVDLRINIYRGQVTTKTSNGIDSADKVSDNEQEQQIYKHVLENGFITTATVIELLEVKQRRARVILLNMIESGGLKKLTELNKNSMSELFTSSDRFYLTMATNSDHYPFALVDIPAVSIVQVTEVLPTIG